MAEELFGGQDVGATPSYKEQAYRLIKEAILFNRFRVGAIYSQDDICKELGISRTPVREALLELQKDGYVSFSRGKGVQVVPVSDRDARDILETRMYIECINAKLAANRAAQRDLQAMRESLDRLRDQLSTRDGQHLYRLDHIFHRAVAAATQNRLLYRECELLLDHYLRFEVKSVYNNSIDAKIAGRRICHSYADSHSARQFRVRTDIPVILTITFNGLCCPGTVVCPGKRTEIERRTMVCPVHHILGGIHTPFVHPEEVSLIFIMTGIYIETVSNNQRCWVGS